MKIQLIILLFLATSLCYSANFSFLIIPAVSSARLPLDSVSATGLSALDPASVTNLPNNITISGNLNLTGSSVVNFVGGSSSTRVNVYLYGSIFINDNATLVLKHANLYFMGATKPYSRSITLSSSNGYPQLIITDASIVAVTGVTSRIRGYSYSYGAAIYAYNKSEVVATQFSFSRQTIASLLGFNYGGPTKIGCYGGSSVHLNSVKVESMFTYGEANVTVYGGTVAGSLGLYNSSVADFYGVSFPNTVVADNAHLVLGDCSELGSSMITSTGHSRVDLINGTTVAAFTIINSLGIVTTAPGINATGDSEVYFFSSTTSSAYGGQVVSVYDNATFVEQGSSMNNAAVFAFGNSSVLFNNTTTAGSLENVEIIGNDLSSVSVFSCSLAGDPNPVSINLFDRSHLGVVNSTISGGYCVFSNNSAAYLWDTNVTSSRIIVQHNASLAVVGGSRIEDSIEMRENASLSLVSSTASLIYCPDSSHASFVHGSVTELVVSENSTVHLMNSTVQELSLAESNVNGSLSGLTSFIENSTLTLPGSSSDVSVLDTTVNGLDFSLSGNSNVIISNSTLRNLSLQGSSIVTLENASVYSGLDVHGNSTVVLYTPLRVRCVDYFGNPLKGSVVTVNTHSGGTRGFETETADKSGWASFIFFSGIVNATGSFPVGFATVTGSFGDVSSSENFNVALVSEEMTLSLPLPWWSGYILPVIILVAIVALLVFINYAYKRLRARQ
jgi:hypothetical protein